VEMVSCCGLRVVRTHCGESVNECDCGMSPGEPAPTPDAPLPTQSRETQQFMPAPQATAMAWLPADSAQAPVRVQTVPPRSHSETQAILCIWRT
jgi:hypothetical protein